MTEREEEQPAQAMSVAANKAAVKAVREVCMSETTPCCPGRGSPRSGAGGCLRQAGSAAPDLCGR
ncbi:MAG: hypothetical protein Tsb0013_14580 [Phycisphaerales bacterium]